MRLEEQNWFWKSNWNMIPEQNTETGDIVLNSHETTFPIHSVITVPIL